MHLQKPLDSGRPDVQCRIMRIVAQLLVFDQMRDHVDAKAVDAAPQPEAHNVEHRLAHLWIAPVEIGLLGQKGVIVILAARRVEGPGAAAEMAQPIVGRTRPGAPSRQIYQSRLLAFLARLSLNQGCSIEVWFGTKSRMILSPRAWASATSASKISSDPKIGSTPQ